MYSTMSSAIESLDPLEYRNTFTCENCDETQPFLFRCEECDQSLCYKCDSVFHKRKKLANHERQRVSGGVNYEEQKDQVKEFRKIMFAEPFQEVEDTEFVLCGDKTFTPEILESVYKNCLANPENSLLSCLISEIRDACRLKEDFTKVLCMTKNIGGLENASTNDFIICLLDATKNVSQKQMIFECLTRFDYPVVLGHWFCGLGSTAANIYGLHLSELNHLIHCNLLEDESNEHVKHAIILSVGTDGSHEKSKFLNTIWKTKFEKGSKHNGFHHNGQLELAVATELSKRNEHILDVHGNVTKFPLLVLQSLLNCVDLILLHCNEFDFSFKQNKLNSECQTVIQDAISYKGNSQIVLLIHGVEDKCHQIVEGGVKNILLTNFGDKILNRVSIFILINNWQDDKEIILTHQAVSSMLSNVTCSQNALKKIFESLNSVQYLETDSIILTKTMLPESMKSVRLNSKKILNAFKETCTSWFPLNNNSSQIATLDDMQYEGLDVDNEMQLQMDTVRDQRREIISVPVKFFRDEIANKDNFDEISLLFTLFQQELSNKFQPIVSKYRKEIKHLKDELATKSLKDQKERLVLASGKLIAYDIAGIHFIRELVERFKDGIDENAGKGAINICQSELLIGRSIEIVNGDSLTIATSFLQNVFDPIFQPLFSNKQEHETMMTTSVGSGIHRTVECNNTEKLEKLISVTVIGIESSGKSTLWNELWNSNFPVAHGKCSRGFWTSLIQVKNGPFLLVNDTEGILSPLCTKPRFDQKLILLAFALSNIVVINVRGEGDNVLINLLKLVVYAAHKLSLFHRPHLVFVHRDVMGQREHEQGLFKNNLLLQLREACETLEQSGHTIDIDKIINVSQIHSFDLPSAIVEPNLDVAGHTVNKEERTAEFIIRCRELRQNLIQIAREISKDDSRQIVKGIGGEFGWISFAEHMWDLAKQNASLWTYSSVNEKLQRSYIEKHLDHLIHTLIFVDLKSIAKSFMEQFLKDRNDPANQNIAISNFGSFLTQLQLDCVDQMEQKLKEIINQFPGTTIPAEIISEYNRKAKRFVSDAIEDQHQIFSRQLQDLRIKDNIKQKFHEVLRKIDELDKSESEAKIEDSFNAFVTEATKQMEALYKQHGVFELKQSANAYYCSLSLQLKHSFAAEFIASHRDINDCHKETAAMFHKTFLQNVSNRTNHAVDNLGRTDYEKFPPVWTVCRSSSMTAFDQPNDATILLNDLQDAVYQLLWAENMKTFDNAISDWQVMVKKLCFLVDDYVERLYEQHKSKSNSKSHAVPHFTSYQLQEKYFPEGYLQSMTNLMHTFANSMLIYFLIYQNELSIASKVQKFSEYCNKHKKEVILRTQIAQSGSDAAKTTAAQIIHKISTHLTQIAMEDMKEKFLTWEIHPEDIINNAISISFHEKNADQIFRYITMPIPFLKNVFKQQYDTKFYEIARYLQLTYFDIENPQSYFNNICHQLQNAFMKWHESVDNNMSSEDAMNMLFMLLDECKLNFLLEIKNSILKYMTNSTENFAINNINKKRFALELGDQLGDKLCKEKFTFIVPVSIYSEIFEECWPKARGCEKVCPYCGGKCCGGYAHVKHYSAHHLIQAFAGCRHKETREPLLRICSDPVNFNKWLYKKTSYDTSKDVPQFMSYEDHIKRYNKDWIILPKVNKLLDDDLKIGWMLVRDRLGKYFNYKTTTPKEWKKLYDKYLKKK